ncbi:hypothetical protein [Candidatus Hodgkinia cicadicola]
MIEIRFGYVWYLLLVHDGVGKGLEIGKRLVLGLGWFRGDEERVLEG